MVPSTTSFPLGLGPLFQWCFCPIGLFLVHQNENTHATLYILFTRTIFLTRNSLEGTLLHFRSRNNFEAFFF